jgi:chorismate dehydratase
VESDREFAERACETCGQASNAKSRPIGSKRFDIFSASEFTGFLREETFYIKTAPPPTKIARAMSAILKLPRKVRALSARGKTPTLPKLRISVVQYLNTAPLVWSFTNGPLRGKYELSFTVPSLCAEALRTGAVDVAIIPAIEYQRIDDLVILPDMAIASKTRVRSLLLVSRMPIEKIRKIALDSGSRSTQALVKILCHQKWKIAPEFFEMAPDLAAMLQRAEAALVIGDPALRLSLAMESGTRRGEAGEQICAASALGIEAAGIDGDSTLHIYDVVEQWRRMTTLPAVLAAWAARRKTVTPEVIADFQSSRDFGLRHLPEISTQAAAELGLPANKLQRYLTENINFSLDEENLRGLTAYFKQAADLNLIPQAKPIEIAAARPERLRDAYATPR